jgi:hypothetical protein
LDSLQTIDPMSWIILILAAAISLAVLFNKAIKWVLKLAVIAIMAVYALYFLVQANIIELPTP